MSAFIFIKTSGLLRTINVHVKCSGFYDTSAKRAVGLKDTTKQTLKPLESRVLRG